MMQNARYLAGHRLSRGLLRRMAAFRRDEEGSMIIFAMFLFLIMLMISGMAVDLMRFESNRARLQATLDRAVLASADLDQILDPEDVVRDYFAKAGLLDQLSSIVVTETYNARQVEATASIDVNMMFMRMLGIDRLAAPAAGTAIENVADIEIILVLDVSGSMAGARITNLKSAARNFVTTVLTPDVEERISIGIVPFNGQVNLGATLLSRYNITDRHNTTNSNCVDLPATAYAGSDITTALAMPQTGHVDTGIRTSFANQIYNRTSYPPQYEWLWCSNTANNVVTLPTRNIATLHANINRLEAIGATSINAGMRWGMELLDPGTRPMFNTLLGNAVGQIPPRFSDRPFDYRQENTSKIIVLMTDGEHFVEERLNAGYRSGLSPIYRSNNDGNYSIFHASRSGNNKYFVPHLSNTNNNNWRDRPWTNNNNNGTAVQQTWPQVWAAVRLEWVAHQLYGRALGGNNATAVNNQRDIAVAAMRTQTPTSAMDAQLEGLCQMASRNRTIVYGIAFDAGAHAEQMIYNCSSSVSHYYDAANTEELIAAFRSIANQINSLRLIQ